MKKCTNCGTELSDEQKECPNCGNIEEAVAIEQTEIKTTEKRSVIAIIAFIVSLLVLPFITFITVEFFTVESLGILFIVLFLFIGGVPSCLVSVVLSVVATCLVVKKKRRGKGLAFASVALSAVSLCAIIVMIALIGTVSNS